MLTDRKKDGYDEVSRNFGDYANASKTCCIVFRYPTGHIYCVFTDETI